MLFVLNREPNGVQYECKRMKIMRHIVRQKEYNVKIEHFNWFTRPNAIVGVQK